MVEWCMTKMGECEVRDWKEQEGPKYLFSTGKSQPWKVELGPDWKKKKTNFEWQLSKVVKGFHKNAKFAQVQLTSRQADMSGDAIWNKVNKV